MKLTQQQRDTFAEQGWLVIGPLIDAAQVERLRCAFDARMRIFADEIDVPVDEYLQVVSQWTNLWERDADFQQQMHNPVVAELACQLIGCEKVRVLHDHLIAKPPRQGNTIPWHRDLPNWPVREPRLLSVWLALDDVTVDSGAMRFMPGGHKEPMTQSIDFLNDTKEWGDREKEAVPVEVPAGWAVVHHCLSWHTSPPNNTDGWRRAYITICMDATCTYDPERADWHPINSRVTVPPGAVFNDDAFPILGRSLGEPR